MIQVIYIAYVFFIIFLSLIPVSTGAGVQYLDKVEHILAYFVMGVLAYISTDTLGRRIVLYIFMFLLGVSIELFQMYIPGRDASVYDAMANTAGLALSFLLCRAFSLLFKGHVVSGTDMPGL